MDLPKISIITVCFNDAAGLEKTLSSAQEQTYKNTEHIVIDGNSSDGSKDILKKYRDYLSYAVSESDKGIYNAMNKGIKVANGTYLQFLNAGDYYTSPTILEEFVNAPNFSGDIIYGDYQFEKGKKEYPDTVTPLYMMKSSLPHQSTLFKKSVFDTMGLYNEEYTITSDREFYIKCLLNGNIIFTRVPLALTVFDKTGRSNDADHQEIKKAENEKVFKEYFGPYYDDLKLAMELQHENNRLKRNKLVHFFKRVKKKMMP